MSFKKFCPRCGKENLPFVGKICIDCFNETVDLIKVPERIEIPVSVKSGRIRVRGKWVEQSEKDLIEFVESKIKVKEIHNPKIQVKLFPQKDETSIVKIKVFGEIDGVIIEQRKESKLFPLKTQTDAEMRLGSDYFEGIIQVRGTKESTEKEFNSVKKKLRELVFQHKEKDEMSQIIKEIEFKNGFDLHIGSRKGAKFAAKKLAEEIGTKVVDSAKLIGRDKMSGKDIYRVTFLVRINQDSKS
ncbi:MAG TPA: 60S ribosomal export protein NMD3 [archaeon]|nr:60S ribosomal export protein NMD3 [archaeon]